MVITIPGVLTSHFVHSGALWNEGNPYAVLQWPLTQTQIKSVMNSSIGRLYYIQWRDCYLARQLTLGWAWVSRSFLIFNQASWICLYGCPVSCYFTTPSTSALTSEALSIRFLIKPQLHQAQFLLSNDALSSFSFSLPSKSSLFFFQPVFNNQN